MGLHEFYHLPAESPEYTLPWIFPFIRPAESLGTTGSGISGKGDFATEHILEWQVFSKFLSDEGGNGGCKHWSTYWKPLGKIDVPGCSIGPMEPMEWVGAMFPSKVFHTDEFMLLEENVNGRKEKIWQGKAIGTTTINYIKGRPQRRDGTDQDREDRQWSNRQVGLKATRNAILAVKYMQLPKVNDIIVTQAKRILDIFNKLEDNVLKLEWAHYYQANSKTYPDYPKIIKSMDGLRDGRSNSRDKEMPLPGRLTIK